MNSKYSCLKTKKVKLMGHALYASNFIKYGINEIFDLERVFQLQLNLNITCNELYAGGEARKRNWERNLRFKFLTITQS